MEEVRYVLWDFVDYAGLDQEPVEMDEGGGDVLQSRREVMKECMSVSATESVSDGRSLEMFFRWWKADLVTDLMWVCQVADLSRW